MQQKYAISLYVNICFLHAKCLQNRDNIFFLIASFYISSVTETAIPNSMILQVKNILKLLKDFQHEYSNTNAANLFSNNSATKAYSLLWFLVLLMMEEKRPVFGGGPINIGA